LKKNLIEKVTFSSFLLFFYLDFCYNRFRLNSVHMHLAQHLFSPFVILGIKQAIAG